MDCPICGKYGKTYASKPLGVVKIRYRKCDGCNHKYRTFEEIDTNFVVRGHSKIPRFPVCDPAKITCPQCQGLDLRHDRKSQKGDEVTHFYSCRGCKAKFGVETGNTDPISAARNAAKRNARILCPECAGNTHCISKTNTRTGTTIRQECQVCKHRFTYRTHNDGRPPIPALILAGELDHTPTA